MKINFFDVFKYTIFRRISNAIINKTINKATKLNSTSTPELINQGYIIPNGWDIVKTLFFFGWVMVVPYVVASFNFQPCNGLLLNISSLHYTS